MSITFEIGGIANSGFVRGLGCFPIYESTEIEGEERGVDLQRESSSASSSSIGKDSDAAGKETEEDEEDVNEGQSAYKGPLLGAIESLVECLPIRRGISNFYAGRSKSFASLSGAVASCASAKDLGKADNAHNRRRRNLLASKTMWERPHINQLRSVGGGIAKKPSNPMRTTLALAVAMSTSPSSSRKEEDGFDHLQFHPVLHPPGKSSIALEFPASCPSHQQQTSLSLRSFSLGDLHAMSNLDSPHKARLMSKAHLFCRG